MIIFDFSVCGTSPARSRKCSAFTLRDLETPKVVVVIEARILR
jgi:hypothetical protein